LEALDADGTVHVLIMGPCEAAYLTSVSCRLLEYLSKSFSLTTTGGISIMIDSSSARLSSALAIATRRWRQTSILVLPFQTIFPFR